MTTFLGLPKWTDALTRGIVKHNPIAFFSSPGSILHVWTPHYSWWNDTEPNTRVVKRYQKTGTNMSVPLKINYKSVTVNASLWYYKENQTNVGVDIYSSASNPPQQAQFYNSANASANGNVMSFNRLIVPTWVPTTALQNWINNAQSDDYKPANWLYPRKGYGNPVYLNQLRKKERPLYNPEETTK